MSLAQVWKDPQFGAAIAVAPFFWVVFRLLGTTPFGFSFPLQAPLDFFMPALIYPVLEEMVFRGLIQENLYRLPWGCRRAGPVSAANFATSVLFALGHWLVHSPLRAIGVFFPALIFGYFRDRYGRIVPSIVLHVFYNTGYMLLFAGYS